MFETDSTTNTTTICAKTDIYAQKTGTGRIPKGSRGITNSTSRILARWFPKNHKSNLQVKTRNGGTVAVYSHNGYRRISSLHGF
ncbi:hypothetical protein CIW82_18805 (plasmid) [Acetobacter tropicalis]|uniref:Uncharacterized protein n=1 Tax=Acetobacter tropicalis TaxID=104102 RepID=A0A291PN84_9PROT|nr:hypothetical protein CIW82_18805 [Acetobacter tropicalis]